MSTYQELFFGSDIEEYAERADNINRMYVDGELTEEEMIELIRDLKVEVELDESVANIQITSDLLRLLSTVGKLI
jgi:hypothetical protein